MSSTGAVIRAFAEEHVERLTGLSRGQLRSWDKRGFFRPRYAYEDRQSQNSRIYSFEDVVGLRMIAVLRNQYRISLPRLMKAAAELEQRGFSQWTLLKLYVLKGQVLFQVPQTEKVEGLSDGQFAMLPVIDVINDVDREASELSHRTPAQVGKFKKSRTVMRNALVIAGTRIPTGAIWRYFENGFSIEQILTEYPSLTRDDVDAALRYEKKRAHAA